MLETTLYRNWRAITSPRGFCVFITVFVALCFGLRVALFPGGSQDDSEMLLLSQNFEGIYKPGQPPLLNWLLTALFGVFGPSETLLIAQKAVAVLATYLLLYLAARLILADERLAALAGASPVAVYLFSWDGLFNYSHTLLMLSMVAATLYATFRLRRKAEAGIADFLGLGALLGAGLLTKYNFAIFAGGLLIAAVCDPPLRARFRDRRALWGLGAALAITLPHLVWLLAHRAQIATAYRSSFLGEQTPPDGWLEGVVSGLGELGSGLVAFMLPLPLLLVALFPRVLLPVRRTAGRERGAERLLLVMMASMLAIILAGVLAAGVNTFHNHYLLVFLPFPLWYLARLEAIGPSPVPLQRYAGVLSVIAAVVVLAVIGRFLIDPSGCRRCYIHIPYGALAEQIRQAGFDRGTILTWHRFIQIGGNLRAQFPESRVYNTKYPGYLPPRRSDDGQCLIVWNALVPPDQQTSMRDKAVRKFGARITGQEPVRTAETGLWMAPERRFRLGYIILPRGAGGECR